jgi:hypothetical protein
VLVAACFLTLRARRLQRRSSSCTRSSAATACPSVTISSRGISSRSRFNLTKRLWLACGLPVAGDPAAALLLLAASTSSTQHPRRREDEEMASLDQLMRRSSTVTQL